MHGDGTTAAGSSTASDAGRSQSSVLRKIERLTTERGYISLDGWLQKCADYVEDMLIVPIINIPNAC